MQYGSGPPGTPDEPLDPIGLAADYLFSLRVEKRIELGIPAGFRPANFRSAYAIQERLVAKLLGRSPGACIGGYKVACVGERTPSTQALRLHSHAEPFFGRLLSPTTFISPGRLRSEGYFTHGIEAAFSFLITKDIVPGSGPHSVETIAEYIGGILPSIEVLETRFADWTKVGACQLAADNAMHGAWVQGAVVQEWEGVHLEQQVVSLRVNGRTVREGRGKNLLGNPLNAVTWLANELEARGETLQAGQVVSTGAASDLYIARPGERIEADFGPIGIAELTVVP